MCKTNLFLQVRGNAGFDLRKRTDADHELPDGGRRPGLQLPVQSRLSGPVQK